MLRRLLPLLAACAVLTAGCDTHELQEEFADAASAPPAGFVRTDEGGSILDEDRDDWRTAPLFATNVRVSPAYPNPTAGEFVTIPITIVGNNAVRGGLILRGFDASGRLVILDEERYATQVGAYILSFSPALLGRKGLHRVYIFDGASELVSYGDVMVE